MRKIFFALFVIAVTLHVHFGCMQAQELKPIILNPPDKARGLSFMETLAVKASAVEWSDKELNLQDLSDLLWAANGLNRPEENKTTASSAMNAHDVDLYFFMKEGVYLYDFAKHQLNPVLKGDHRKEIMRARPPRPEGRPGESPAPAGAPVPGQPGPANAQPAGQTGPEGKPEAGQAKPGEAPLGMQPKPVNAPPGETKTEVGQPAWKPGTPLPGAQSGIQPGTQPSGQISEKQSIGTKEKNAGQPGGPMPPQRRPESNPPVQIILVSDISRFRMGSQDLKLEWAAIDAGIVSQNISLFCAATGLKTRPRASMDREKIKQLLNLKETQYVLLNHPVGYAK